MGQSTQRLTFLPQLDRPTKRMRNLPGDMKMHFAISVKAPSIITVRRIWKTMVSEILSVTTQSKAGHTVDHLSVSRWYT